MQLEKLIPKISSFKLSQLDDSLTMKPITLADEIWLRDTFGVDGLKEMFQKVNFEEIPKIVWRLLDNDSKGKLKSQSVTVYNDKGEETEHKIGGVNLLMALITGLDEKEDIINALMGTLGFSEKHIDEIAEDSSKKKVQ